MARHSEFKFTVTAKVRHVEGEGDRPDQEEIAEEIRIRRRHQPRGGLPDGPRVRDHRVDGRDILMDMTGDMIDNALAALPGSRGSLASTMTT